MSTSTRILLASPIFPDAVERLRERHDVACAFDASEEALSELIADRDVLVFRSGVNISADLMRRAATLRLLIRAGSGLDNIDTEYVRDRGLELVRIPQPGAQAVAELAFAFMLMLSRDILGADRSMRQGRWAKHGSEGRLLKGRTLGVVGLGSIGGHVADMGLAWGMTVCGCVERPTPARVSAFARRGIELAGLDQVVRTADLLSVHVPLTPTTRGLIDADVLGAMKPGSFLVNLARGGIVDELALRDALADGSRVKGAALDVHEHEGDGVRSPLAPLSNVVLTPHIGAMAVDAQQEIGRRVNEIVDRFADAQKVVHAGSNGGPR